MTCVISATNRPNSNTNLIASHYFNCLSQLSDDIQYFSLENLPENVLHNSMYETNSQSSALIDIQNNYFIKPDKWIIVVPEYNGGIPGVFKLLIDIMSVRQYEKTFKGKKICLVGVSSGRAGNLRGLDYLTNVFHYLKCDVFSNKLPISSIERLITEKGELDASLALAIEDHAKAFLNI